MHAVRVSTAKHVGQTQKEIILLAITDICIRTGLVFSENHGRKTVGSLLCFSHTTAVKLHRRGRFGRD